MTDVLERLPPFSWRGKLYPVLARDVGFAHENATHKVQFKNGALVEMTGAQNLTFRYTLALRQDIGVGPYEDLFTTALTPLLNDCLLRTPGILVDPVHGQFRCVPAVFGESTDNNRRDGSDVQVEFQRAPELDEVLTVEQPDGLQGVIGQAHSMEVEVEKVDWKQTPSPQPSIDILGFAAGVLGQVSAQRDRISAIADDIAFRMEKVDKAADDLEDPRVWPLKRAARRNQMAALELKKHLDNPGRRIISVTKAYAQTITAVAASTGMTVVELLKLNPGLSRAPLVRAGTQVLVYQKAG